MSPYSLFTVTAIHVRQIPQQADWSLSKGLKVLKQRGDQTEVIKIAGMNFTLLDLQI